MEVNRENLEHLYIAYNAAMREGLTSQEAEIQHTLVTMETRSQTAEESYGWLKQMPGLRRWLGDRVVNNLSQEGMRIRNADWEETWSVDRNDIEDDRYMLLASAFRAAGMAAARHPDEVVWEMLGKGWDEEIWDGQNFFDTDHPYTDSGGAERSQANTEAGGAGAAWYLLDSKMLFKPIVWQVRKRPDNLTRMDSPTDEAVFARKEFRYGLDCRDAAGWGFWQGIYGSKHPLNKAKYELARQTMHDLRGDGGRKLGVKPDTLIVPSSLEGAARRLLGRELDEDGATNEWKDTAKVELVTWL